MLITDWCLKPYHGEQVFSARWQKATSNSTGTDMQPTEFRGLTYTHGAPAAPPNHWPQNRNPITRIKNTERLKKDTPTHCHPDSPNMEEVMTVPL